jgi:hypothetical protein
LTKGPKLTVMMTIMSRWIRMPCQSHDSMMSHPVGCLGPTGPRQRPADDRNSGRACHFSVPEAGNLVGKKREKLGKKVLVLRLVEKKHERT